MFSALQKSRTTDSPRSLAAAASSIGLHAIAFALLLHAPAVRLPRPAESEYKQAFAGKEEKIVWYKFRRELPRTNPPRSRTERQPLRAKNGAKQAIVAAAENAPERKRMVWTPAPELRAAPPLESPNVVAVKLPSAPPAKQFTPPTAASRPIATVRTVDAPPEVATSASAAARLPNLTLPDANLAPKPFTAPQVTKPKIAVRKIVSTEAPSIAAASQRALEIPPATLAARPFTAAPTRAPRSLAAPAAAPDAPALNASSLQKTGLKDATNVTPALAPKPFTAPAASSAAAHPNARGISLEPAPPVLEANSKDLNLAMVGLNPVDRPLPPAASSPANFSAGPQNRSTGAAAEGHDGGLAVPGLFVGNPRQERAPDLIAHAYDAPTSSASLRAAINSAGPAHASSKTSETEATSHSGAVRVASAPEPQFEGRDVFMMAIQMPNLTSYSGSWLMWYADRTQRQAGLSPIAPPTPHRKVDPKYIASAVAERIEGKIRLACVITKDGNVGGVELLRGIDDRLNRSAEEALGKWEFYPATRNGAPVDVDVVVEIPFRLEPLTPKP